MGEGDNLKKIPRPSPPGEGDDLAERESQALSNERDLEKEATERDHDRQQQLKDYLLAIIKIGIFVIAMLLILGVVIWGYHLITPQSWHWLTENQLVEIQKLMTSALLAIVISDYAKKYF